MKIVSIIPARGGSKEIPRKNLVKINGLPLVVYSIKQSLSSKLIDETYVSTEDEEIAKISKSYGAKIIDRPKILASDTATTDQVLVHAAAKLNWDFDFMVCLQPTSPLRDPWQIDSAIKKLLWSEKNALMSVCKNNRFLWDANGLPILHTPKLRLTRQNKTWEYTENGNIYIVEKEFLKREKTRFSIPIELYLMNYYQSFEIDSYFDLDLIKFIMGNGRNIIWK